MDRNNYQSAIDGLKKGHVPENIDEVKNHAMTAMFELKQYVDALTECVYRLNQTNRVLRHAVERGINDRKRNP